VIASKEQAVVETQKEIKVTWHALSAEEAVQQLETVQEMGLSSEEAKKRLEKYGLNQLQEKPRPTFFQLVLEQLKNFLIIMLIAASILSIVLGEYVDASAILAIVLLNAILGVVQESRAEEAFAALQKMAAPEAHVMRDGHPGDVTGF